MDTETTPHRSRLRDSSRARGVSLRTANRSRRDVHARALPAQPGRAHHTALTVREQPDAPDGVNQCDLSEVAPRNLGSSGVGTKGGSMPAGIAMKLARGSQLLLNLHLFNFSDAPHRGCSGARVLTTTRANVTTLADGLAVGPLKLMLPPRHAVVRGTCTVDHDHTIFSVLLHMHHMGVHLKVVAHRAAGDLMIYDAAYAFEDQLAYPLEPIALSTGDTIDIECHDRDGEPGAAREKRCSIASVQKS